LLLGLALTLALLLALAAVASRRLRRRRIGKLASSLPGALAGNPIRVAEPGEIDDALRARRCICGGFLTSLGERSEVAEDRVLRVVRAECNRCEAEQSVYFDTERLLH
jgi:hypothetical protein